MQERPCGATGGVVGELWKICPAGLTRRITKNHEGTRRNTKEYEGRIAGERNAPAGRRVGALCKRLQPQKAKLPSL